MNQALYYYSLVFDILCVTYFLTSIAAWPANQRYVSDTVNDISAHSGISSLSEL